jgi:hypothetical protein
VTRTLYKTALLQTRPESQTHTELAFRECGTARAGLVAARLWVHSGKNRGIHEKSLIALQA